MSDEKKPEDMSPNAESAGPAPSEGAGGEISAAQLKEIVQVLQSELDAKTEALAQKHDQFVRAAAETENVRRRLEKEKQETARYAITKFAKDVLSIGDNFQRAISAVPKDAVETDPALKSLLDGVVLAERDFRSVLERHGVIMVDATGQPFDPHQHQAVMEQENASVPTGTVLQVFQVGYMIDDRCLRPAMVVVSRGGPKAEKASDAARNAAADAAPPQADESTGDAGASEAG